MDFRSPRRMSYSSMASYAECGERWRLERGYGLSSSTWWATVAGSAIHEITEAYDRGEPMPDFETKLDEHAAMAAERDQEIKASGRVTKVHGKTGGPNKKDRDWWLIEGPLVVQRYVEWRALTGWELFHFPDGQLSVEVRLTEPVAGKSHLGFIDRVFTRPDGGFVIVDIKTGNAPASKMQLGVYRMGLLKQYGLDVKFGGYWMGADGDFAGGLHDLSGYTEEFMEHQYEMAWRGIEAGVFLPNVSSMCAGCNVRDFCRAVGGKSVAAIPLKTPTLRDAEHTLT